MSNTLKYDSLDSLNDTKYDWRIKVRVIRIWDSFSSKGDKEFKGRNMLLLDDKHTRMHAFIWPNYMDEFKLTFEEGKIYSIRNFSVKTYRKESLRCTRSDKQIWLSNHTKVISIEDNPQTDKMIRNMEFDFFDISDIREIVKQDDNKHLIDVIGVLKDKDVLRHFTNQKSIEQCTFRFTLTDGSASIKVCFWDELAQSFVSELDKVTEMPIIVIVASCKHNEYREEPYVSNVGATRFFINYNHRAVAQLKQRAILPNFDQYQPAARDNERFRVITIAQLRSLNDAFVMEKVMCQVTVRTVKETQDWTYDVCTSCQQEVEMISGKFKCAECKRTVPYPDKSFRLCLIAEDTTGAAAFIVFNREVEAIIGKIAYDVIAEQEREGKTAEFPTILKTFEGNNYTINICVTNDNVSKGSHTYSVIDMYEGYEINENNSPDDDDLSVGFKQSQSSSIHSMSKNTMKTPDTEKSSNTNRLKRLNDDAVISITNLEDDADGDGHGVLADNIVQLKQIKKEKV